MYFKLLHHRAGRKEGFGEGGALGVRQGFLIGQEIGFYSGCAQVWRHLESKSSGFLHPRAEKVVASLEQLLRSFPLQDPKVLKAILEQLK